MSAVSGAARWRATAALLLLLGLVVVAERARWFAVLLGIPEVKRSWIWSADPPRKVEPRAFYAARDFDLDSAPNAALLEVLGDPEYVAFVNGARVGSGRPGAEPQLDRFEVASLLRAGTNRIVLELRSPTGSGAATARLVGGDGRTLVETDAAWVVYRSSWRGLLAGEPFFPTGTVSVIGRSPFARWAGAVAGEARPRFDEAVVGQPVPAVAVRNAPDEPWRPLPPDPPRKLHLGRRVELDFGREVVGYLQLGFDRRTPTRGLLRFGAAPTLDPGWDPDVVVLSPASRNAWQDAVPRRFRYVELIGIPEVSRATLFPVSEEAFARLAPRAETLGLLGARPFPVRLPVVDEIWREYGLPSSAVAATAAPAAAEPAATVVKPAGGGRTKARAPKRGARRPPAGR